MPSISPNPTAPFFAGLDPAQAALVLPQFSRVSDQLVSDGRMLGEYRGALAKLGLPDFQGPPIQAPRNLLRGKVSAHPLLALLVANFNGPAEFSDRFHALQALTIAMSVIIRSWDKVNMPPLSQMRALQCGSLALIILVA